MFNVSKRIVHIYIEKPPEGVYLAASDDVARKLIEAWKNS